MKRVLVKSVYDAFDYVMAHYYPYGLEALAERKDSYAVISIQDTHTEGFGIRFCESRSCRGVLTLLFDDVEREVPEAVLFSREQAGEILDFLGKYRDADTLLVHCYGGESRSRAVGAFAEELLLGKESSKYLSTGNANRHVYEILRTVWSEQEKTDT